MLVQDANYQQWEDGLWARIQGGWAQTPMPYRQQFDVIQANERLPVVDKLGIPARGLFILMCLFGIVIGPVNLWLLTRWKRRLWLLWTVPVISAVTCAMVFGYMVLAEGWSGHLHTQALTVLDDSSGRAATIGGTGFYSPLTPGGGLHFDHDTELTLQAAPEPFDHFRGGPRRGAPGRRCSVEWGADQHLDKGWMAARIPTHFQLRKNERRRERVAVSRDADGYSALNGLGVEINQLWFADDKGQLYSAGAIAPGARARLKPAGRELPGEQERTSLRAFYCQDWLGQIKTLRQSPQRLMQPLSYLADVEGSPFVEDGLKDAGTRRYGCLVLGLLKELEKE